MLTSVVPGLSVLRARSGPLVVLWTFGGSAQSAGLRAAPGRGGQQPREQPPSPAAAGAASSAPRGGDGGTGEQFRDHPDASEVTLPKAGSGGLLGVTSPQAGRLAQLAGMHRDLFYYLCKGCASLCVGRGNPLRRHRHLPSAEEPLGVAAAGTRGAGEPLGSEAIVARGKDGDRCGETDGRQVGEPRSSVQPAQRFPSDGGIRGGCYYYYYYYFP